MPIAHISILEGRSKAQRRALVRAVTGAIAENLEVPKERVRVLIQEVRHEDWGIGGETVEERRGRG